MKVLITFFALFLLFSNCKQKGIILNNPNVNSMAISEVNSEGVYPFKILSDMYKYRENSTIKKNFEVFSSFENKNISFFYNWNPENRLLFLASGPFECKGSGLSSVFSGLDSVSIKKLEKLSLKELNDSTLKSNLTIIKINVTNIDQIVNSLNSNTCNIFKN